MTLPPSHRKVETKQKQFVRKTMLQVRAVARYFHVSSRDSKHFLEEKEKSGRRRIESTSRKSRNFFEFSGFIKFYFL